MKIDSEFKKIKGIIQNKNIFFITTKNIDYIRNQQELGILREFSKYVKEIGSLKKNYFLRILNVYPNIIFSKKRIYDVFFVGFLPQLILPFFYFLFKRKVIVIDFFISLYDTLVFYRKKVKKNSLLARVLKWMDRVTLKRADIILVDTRSHGEYFLKEFNAGREKITVLYIEANKYIYYPHFVKKPDGIRGKYLILYFGTILPIQGIEIVLKSVDMLKDNNNIFFVVIGKMPAGLLKRYGQLANLKIIEWLEQEKLSDYIAMSDLCLAGHFNNKIEKAKRTIPGKAYIYDAMNKPMILGDNIANREVFSEKDKDVFFVEMGNSEKLKGKILEIYNSTRNSN